MTVLKRSLGQEAQGLKIGVLGDGQLAQMMAIEAKKMGLNFSVLTSDPQSPAALVCSNITLGKTSNQQELLAFSEINDLITIESEFIDPKLLAAFDSKVLPAPKILKTLRDRLPQKQSLIDHGIPTSPLRFFKDLGELKQWMLNTDHGLVLKQRLFGYDGYGTRILKTAKDIEALDSNLDLNEWIAEDLIVFSKELAISFARNASGQILEFPLVESFQENSKCLWVKGPMAKSPHTEFVALLKKFVESIEFVGLISFELFQTPKGLIVNEIAPRVHNSAHYSLEALEINQFKAHLMAICNLDLPETTKIKQPFSMYNLIGETNFETTNLKLPNQSEVHLHWYGKKQCKPGRKMGHLTALADTADEALLKLKKARKDFSL